MRALLLLESSFGGWVDSTHRLHKALGVLSQHCKKLTINNQMWTLCSWSCELEDIQGVSLFLQSLAVGFVRILGPQYDGQSHCQPHPYSGT